MIILHNDVVVGKNCHILFCSFVSMSKHKILGQVYTPGWIVELILDNCGYTGNKVLNSKIIEPSCGDGVFIIQIIKRIIVEAKVQKLTIDKIKSIIQNNVYGIEIDNLEYNKCIVNIKELLIKELDTSFALPNLFNEDTLDKYEKLGVQFDFVVGNPPYIRIHNLESNTRDKIKRKFTFAEGTIDIYITFFELGIKLLNTDGILGYITPNSYINNSSYQRFRSYLSNSNMLNSIIDFKSNKIFNGFSTYTAITIIKKNRITDTMKYYEFDNNSVVLINEYSLSNLNQKSWLFTKSETHEKVSKLFDNEHVAVEKEFLVQYGFATLRDRVFICENPEILNEEYVKFNGMIIEKSITRKIVKGSKYKEDEITSRIIFPYMENSVKKNVPYSEQELKLKFPKTYEYLIFHKDTLVQRDLDKSASWFEFGRSQGIQNINKEKLVISTLFKDSIKLYPLPADVFVYSGIFITKRDSNSSFSELVDKIQSNDFYTYAFASSKDFSGGYKLLSTKQLKGFPLKKKSAKIDLFNVSLQ